MARCADFYRKWEAVPNFCEKNPGTARQIERYIDLILALEDRGISQEDTIGRLTEYKLRPILRERDPEVKAAAVCAVEKLLKQKTPTGGAVHKRISKEKIFQIVHDAKIEKVAAQAQAAGAQVDDLEVVPGDFFTWAQGRPEGSIDHILTDPPYVLTWMGPHYPGFIREAYRLLKPGGFLIQYMGTYFLDYVFQNMGDFKYYWLMVHLLCKQNTILQDRLMRNAYTGIVIFYKPPMKRSAFILRDVLHDKSHFTEKATHPWEKNPKLFDKLVDAFTKPGDLVLDPFAGTGALSYFPWKQGRKVIAVEKDPRYIPVIRARFKPGEERGPMMQAAEGGAE